MPLTTVSLNLPVWFTHIVNAAAVIICNNNKIMDNVDNATWKNKYIPKYQNTLRLLLLFFTSSNLNMLACPASMFWSILNFLASECATGPSYTQLRSEYSKHNRQEN